MLVNHGVGITCLNYHGRGTLAGLITPPRLLRMLEMTAHENSIPVHHPHRIPSGTRVHRPITIVKEFDQTAPLLYRAVCEGRTMKKATIKMYRILESGIEAEYFNIILENVKFTTVAPFLSLDAFKRVMDSASKVQMDYICQQYPRYFRFAKWMERLAQGIADGVIEVPKDH